MSIPVARTDDRSFVPSYQKLIEEELRGVEDVLHEELSSRVKTIFSASRHILDAGGKRLRPSLVILAAKSCRGDLDENRAINLAASVELIHMATLVHDDVIDAAESRRGQVTANSLWGNQVSVLTGDYILAKAFSLLSHDGDSRVICALSKATIAMSEGEIRQIESRHDVQAMTSSYLAIIRDKTAEFMSACCRIGGIIGGGASEVQDALARYGLNLGIAFQITDDLLDLIGDPAQTGKPIGSDIREGKITLPVILAREKASPAERASLDTMIRGDGITQESMGFLANLVEETGAVQATCAVASDYLKDAIDAVSVLPPVEQRFALEEIARDILHRRS